MVDPGAAGSRIVTVVPAPGCDRSQALPPAWAAIRPTAGRPSPAAWFAGFVVKNGSKARPAVCGSIPVPVSVTRIAT